MGCVSSKRKEAEAKAKADAWAGAWARGEPVTLTHESDFDTNGAMYYIGTKGGTCEYQNPQTTSAVTVTASSKFHRRYADHRLAQHQHDGQHNCTQDYSNSTMAVALGGGVELEVANYCLRHGLSGGGGGRLRHWDLEASQDGRAWTTLRSHHDDQSLPDAKFSTAGWAVEGGKGAFSQFRIRQTGKNNEYGSDSLCCAGIELYGVLHKPQR